MSNSPEVPETASSSLDRLGGWILMTVGALMATLCGLCSGGVVIMIAAPQIGNINSDVMLFFLILIFGISPMMVGVLIFRAGKGMVRRSLAGAQPSEQPL